MPRLRPFRLRGTRSTPRAPRFPGSKARPSPGRNWRRAGPPWRRIRSPSSARLSFAALFDTSLAFRPCAFRPSGLFPRPRSVPSPAPSDSDVDVARYVRDAEDLDVDVAWATWTPGRAVRRTGTCATPAPEFPLPRPHRGCGQARRKLPVWRLDHVAGEWRRATQDPQWRPRPCELLLIDAADGGYDPETGFDPSSRDPVPGSPELLSTR